MLRLILPLTMLLSFSAVAQELDVVRFIKQFSARGNEITDEYRAEFKDPTNQLSAAHKRVVVESKPINFGTGVMLITSASEPYNRKGTRMFLFSMVNSAHSGPCLPVMADDKDGTFEQIPGDLLIFTYTDRGITKEKVLMPADGRVYDTSVKLKFGEYTELPNKILQSGTFKISPDDATLMLKEKPWGSLKLKQLLANGSITAEQERVLQLLVRNGPRQRGYLTSTVLQPFMTIKGTGMDVSNFWGGLMPIVDTKHDTCFVNMDGLPMNDGNIIGLTRTMLLDKAPKITYTFAWFNGSQLGKPLFLDSDSRSTKQPYPEVTIVADRFIKIVSRDGSGKAIPHYAAYLDGDILSLSEIPKDYMPLFRNHIFARHGYVFKNPVYQNYFGVFDWYKPEQEDAATISGKLMNADERAIVNQLVELEKTK